MINIKKMCKGRKIKSMKNKKESDEFLYLNSKLQTLNSNSGITLVVLVVTILILLILAGVTIGTLVNKDIINLGKDAANKANSEADKTLSKIDELRKELAEGLEGAGTGGNTENPPTSETIKITGISFLPNTVEVKVEKDTVLTPTIEPSNASNKNLKWTSSNPDVATVDSSGKVTGVKAGTVTITAEATDESGISGACTVTVKEETLADLVTKEDVLTEPKEVKDINENKVVIPDGFRVLANGTKNEDIDEVVYNYDSENHTPCVQDGIVIADKDNNQFVWIPVGTINNKADDSRGETTTIALGRYSSWGASPTVVQTQENYEETKTISNYYQESINQTGTNSHAANLKNFIDNAILNGGYWFGRYEASYGEGYNSSGNNDTEKYQDAKPLSVISKANSTSSMSYTKGTLWNRITQSNASIVAQNMKKTGTYKSDLINSYSWDTAIQFIEKYAKSGYANDKSLNSSLSNTGMNNDKQLNIHDMASNCNEWSTEYSTNAVSSITRPCVGRGGYCSSTSHYAALRSFGRVTTSDSTVSFRSVLY